MRRLAVALIGALALASCSKSPDSQEFPRLNDEDLRIDLVREYVDEGNYSYAFEVGNTGETTVGFLRLSMEFPVVRDGHEVNNPFRVQGRKSEGMEPVTLAQGEKATFDVYAPLRGVFEDDVEFNKQPRLSLQGYTLYGEQAIPFELGGSLDAILRKY